MKDISIEYAHIYTNNQIGEEHELSLEILQALKTQLLVQNKSYSLVIMVDDYSFPDPSFNYEEFSAWLTEKGFHPDIIFRESQLIPVCDEVIRHLSDVKLKEELTEYVKAKKYPCSLFIAAWYLLRLGKLKFPAFPMDLEAKELINILPESFKPFEDKGLEIMSKTDFIDSEKAVSYKFIPGRKIS